MALTKWTPKQQQAIEATGGTVLVSAAAGSGKTAVLTQRAIKRMVDDALPIDADRLLVVTFTKAAAQEMKQRLHGKLAKRVAEEPSNQVAKRQLALLPRAPIGTIHSLCFELLKQNFQGVGLPASFRVGDTQELETMRERAVSAALEEAYSQGSKDFFELVELFGDKRGDNALADTLLKILDFARANPFYNSWLAERLKIYEDVEAPAKSVWGQIIMARGEELITHGIALCDKALGCIASVEALSPYAAAIGYDRAFLAQLDYLCGQGEWDELFVTCQGFTHQRLSPVKKATEEDKERVKALREVIKDNCKELCQKLFSTTLDEFSLDIADLLGKLSCLFKLVSEVDSLMLTEKLKTGIIDFSDLEQLTLTLLVEKKNGEIVKTPLAFRCAECYDEVMTDEYQDVNAAQDMLLWALSKGDNRFMVGDVKQSIYRFRQAMPNLFIDKLNNYGDYNGADFPARILLNGSFRARKELTQAVNQIFHAIMSRELGEIDYDATQELIPMAEYPEAQGPFLEVCLITPQEEDGVNELSSAQREAAAVAEKIGELLSSGTTVNEDGHKRPINAGDICILLRSPKNKAELFAKALQSVQVEARVAGIGGFLGSAEILAVTNLLTALSNPTRDIELVGAMLSPLLGFSEDDLARLRTAHPKGSIYGALCKEPADSPMGALLKQLNAWRQLSCGVSAAQLIRQLYEDTGYDLICRAMKGGEQRLANLNLLADYAQGYHTNGYRGLAAFVRILDRMREREEQVSAAAPIGGMEAVTITSIHRSKGLEWPVVFLCDTAKSHSFYQNDLIAPYILHNELGFACVRRDYRLKKQYPSMPLIATRIESERALSSEELRVLYVALTRAKERVIVTGVVKKPYEKLEALPFPTDSRRLAPVTVGAARSFMDWIILGLSQHEQWQDILGEGGRCPEISLKIVGEVGMAEPSNKEESTTPRVTVPQVLLEDLKARLEYTYPYRAAAGIPAKLAASKVAHGNIAAGDFARKPIFASGEALTHAQKGSAVHTFMQLCDYSQAKNDARGELARLLTNKILTQAQGEAVELEKIEAFFASSLGQRILSADKVLREYRFMAPASCSEISKELVTENGESAMLEGIADCVIIKDGKAAIIDYKTDRVSDEEELKRRYLSQLLLYKDMLLHSLDKEVLSCVLYSFHLQKEITVWSKDFD